MLFVQLNQQLRLLNFLLSNLTDEHYQTPVVHLGNASIGEHTRHIIELAQCAINGCISGKVDYINRKRNIVLQQNRSAAIAGLADIQHTIKLPDQNLQLVTTADEDDASTAVPTNYFREIVYITDHTIHHLALIKVALSIMQLNIVDSNFGMAYSTLKYKASTQAPQQTIQNHQSQLNYTE